MRITRIGFLDEQCRQDALLVAEGCPDNDLGMGIEVIKHQLILFFLPLTVNFLAQPQFSYSVLITYCALGLSSL